MKNWDEIPLVTAQVMACKADWHYLRRSLASVAAQTVECEVQVMFDGEPPEELERDLTDNPIVDCLLLGTEREYGYYTMPRNVGTMFVRSPYVAFLDADNEWEKDHLEKLLQAIRVPDPVQGWPAFVYSRIRYVRDEGAPEDCPAGDGAHVPWEHYAGKLLEGPMSNFVDSSSMLWSKGALYRLAELSGTMWNPQCRRFGDWDLVKRAYECGLRGRAVDNLSNVYHWTGKNVQLTRDAGLVAHKRMGEV